MKTASKEQFDKLQSRWQAANSALWNYRAELKRQYGETWHAPRGKEKRLESIRNREEKAMNAMYAWLELHSPRSWSTVCPCSYVMDELTYEDAITHGELSVVPEPAYGYTSRHASTFASATF